MTEVIIMLCVAGITWGALLQVSPKARRRLAVWLLASAEADESREFARQASADHWRHAFGLDEDPQAEQDWAMFVSSGKKGWVNMGENK